jgi:hypothetical protein
MEREAAIRLMRALVAVDLRQRESMANATIRSGAFQAGLKEFDEAHRYARRQGWLVAAGKPWLESREGQIRLRLVRDNCLRPSDCLAHLFARCRGFFFGLIVERNEGPPVNANQIEAM